MPGRHMQSTLSQAWAKKALLLWASASVNLVPDSSDSVNPVMEVTTRDPHWSLRLVGVVEVRGWSLSSAPTPSACRAFFHDSTDRAWVFPGACGPKEPHRVGGEVKSGRLGGMLLDDWVLSLHRSRRAFFSFNLRSLGDLYRGKRRNANPNLCKTTFNSGQQ